MAALVLGRQSIPEQENHQVRLILCTDMTGFSIAA